MSGPKGLPPVDKKSLRFGPDTSALDRARYCEICGQEARIVSNFHGMTAYCGPCQRRWPISNVAMAPLTPTTPSRGIQKLTYVQPDWGKATEVVGGDVLNEQVGPKK